MPDPKIPPDDRTRPPNDDEWPYVWDAVEKQRKLWPILAPVVAILGNIRALLAVLSIIFILNGPRILQLLQDFVGKFP